jgi:hypothetical protein
MSLLSGEAESHRIYWQQWLSTAATTASATTANIPGPGGGISASSSTTPPSSPVRRNRRRQLTTSSAAVRIAPHVAKARDVTTLLRKTLNLASSSTEEDATNEVSSSSQDALVLVGTLQVPHDYVVFEHEQISLSPSSNPSDAAVNTQIQPFHLVKTLGADDNPLAVRDEMMKHLQERQDRLVGQQHHASHSVPPTMQWFFVPGIGAPSIIPNCVELEGYATTMEGQDYTDNEEEEDDNEEEEFNQELYKDDLGESCGQSTVEAAIPDIEVDPGVPEEFVRAGLFESSSPLFSSLRQHVKLSKKQRRESREWRRYLQISQSHNANPICLAGYLLKQSSRDQHVWRKVYCLLTEDYMWYVHRIKPWGQQQSTNSVALNSYLEETIAMSPKHGRISLSQALLLEPNEEFERSPLHRVPHAFQIVDGKGVTHSFRASSKPLSWQWIQSISTRLMDCFENSFLENAELIIAEETMARNQRYKSVAVDGLLSGALALAIGSKTPSQASFASHQNHSMTGEEEEQKQEWSHRVGPELDLYIGPSHDDVVESYVATFRAQVLRLGMDIAEYREGCRHIQATLLSQVGTQSDREEKEPPIPFSSAPILQMVQHSWHVASKLLGQATQLASLVQIGSGHGHLSKKHSSRSLDTLCHHVEFVITGQIRRRNIGGSSLKAEATSIESSTDTAPLHHADDPPPIDLFDNLLSELQQAAAF